MHFYWKFNSKFYPLHNLDMNVNFICIVTRREAKIKNISRITIYFVRLNSHFIFFNYRIHNNKKFIYEAETEFNSTIVNKSLQQNRF
jgi:hypothetical protein